MVQTPEYLLPPDETDANPYAYDGSLDEEPKPPGPFEPFDGVEPRLPILCSGLYQPAWYKMFESPQGCPIRVEEHLVRVQLPKPLAKKYGDIEFEWSHDQARSRIWYEKDNKNKPLLIDFGRRSPEASTVPPQVMNPTARPTGKASHFLKLTLCGDAVSQARFNGWFRSLPPEVIAIQVREARYDIVFTSAASVNGVFCFIGLYSLLVAAFLFVVLPDPVLKWIWLIASLFVEFAAFLGWWNAKKRRSSGFYWGIASAVVFFLLPTIILLSSFLGWPLGPSVPDPDRLGPLPCCSVVAAAFGFVTIAGNIESMLSLRKVKRLYADARQEKENRIE